MQGQSWLRSSHHVAYFDLMTDIHCQDGDSQAAYELQLWKRDEVIGSWMYGWNWGESFPQNPLLDRAPLFTTKHLKVWRKILRFSWRRENKVIEMVCKNEGEKCFGDDKKKKKKEISLNDKAIYFSTYYIFIAGGISQTILPVGEMNGTTKIPVSIVDG